MLSLSPVPIAVADGTESGFSNLPKKETSNDRHRYFPAFPA